MKNFFETFIKFLLGLIVLVGGLTLSGFIFGLPVMWLWNALIPSLFGGPVITFWQSFGLIILMRFIISNVTSYDPNK